MEVHGVVTMAADGSARLVLQPRAAPAPAPAHEAEIYIPRPSKESVLTKIRSGELPCHPSRLDSSLQEITMHLLNVQKAVGLKTGAKGQWTLTAEDRLRATLLKPRGARGRARNGNPLPALEDQAAQPAALAPGTPIAHAAGAGSSKDNASGGRESDTSSDSSEDSSDDSKDSSDDSEDRENNGKEDNPDNAQSLPAEATVAKIEHDTQIGEMEDMMRSTEEALKMEEAESDRLRDCCKRLKLENEHLRKRVAELEGGMSQMD